MLHIGKSEILFIINPGSGAGNVGLIIKSLIKNDLKYALTNSLPAGSGNGFAYEYHYDGNPQLSDGNYEIDIKKRSLRVVKTK